ncbi:hypothetical protein [Methylobacterium sp. CM6257]
MSSNSTTAADQIEHELDDIDDRLKAAERHAGKARKHEDAFWSRVYQALHDIYEVWYPLLNSEHLIEAYCHRHDIDFNSTKRGNRFYAPIQYCFRNARSGGSITHYADTLKEADRIGKKPHELVEWVKKHDGPDGVYAIVAARRKAARAARAAAAHLPVTAPQPASQPVPQPVSTQPGIALPAAPSPATATQPTNTIGRVVDAIRAVNHLVNGKEKRPAGRDDRFFLVRNVAKESGRNLCVENTDSRQTFTTARIALPFAWNDIGDREYMISHREGDRLSRVLSQSPNWTLNAEVDELEFRSAAGHRIVASALSDMDTHHRHMAVPTGHGTHLALTADRARDFLKWFKKIKDSVHTQSRHQRNEALKQIMRHKEILDGLWRQQSRLRHGKRTIMHVPVSNRLLDQNSYEFQMPAKVVFPRALDLVPGKYSVKRGDIDPALTGDEAEEMIWQDVLEVNLFSTYHLPFATLADNLQCQPFHAAGAVRIGEDVRLPWLELECLCEMLVTSGNTASAQFVNTDEVHAALLVEFAHGGEQVRYMIPTVKSASMLRRHACQPLVKSVQAV